MQLSIESEDGNVAQVAAKGRVTQTSLSGAGNPLLDLLGAGAFSKTVLLNLTGAEFIDSSGVSWLLSCHKECKKAGGKLILHSIPQIVTNVLKVLNMQLVLNLADNAQQAQTMAEESTA